MESVSDTLQVTEGKYQHVNVSVISGQLLVDFDMKKGNPQWWSVFPYSKLRSMSKVFVCLKTLHTSPAGRADRICSKLTTKSTKYLLFNFYTSVCKSFAFFSLDSFPFIKHFRQYFFKPQHYCIYKTLLLSSQSIHISFHSFHCNTFSFFSPKLLITSY